MLSSWSLVTIVRMIQIVQIWVLALLATLAHLVMIVLLMLTATRLVFLAMVIVRLIRKMRMATDWAMPVTLHYVEIMWRNLVSSVMAQILVFVLRVTIVFLHQTPS